MTALFTLPLSLLPDLSMLGFTSFLGVGALGYTAIFMLARVSSYKVGSPFYDAVAPALRPRFEGAMPLTSLVRSSKVFVLVSILATAFMAHFLTPQFYSQLSSGTPTKDAKVQKMKRFNVLVMSGFALSGLLSATVMLAGFLTFGGACDGFILNNYASTDKLAQLARFCIGSQIVCTYPLLHQGLRDTIQDALASRGLTFSRPTITIASMALVTMIGLKITDLGIVAAVSGALVSTSLAYVIPSIMFGQLLAKQKADGALSRRLRAELLISRAITVLGVALVGLGMFTAFK